MTDNPQYNPAIHHRRSIRMKGYDYSRAGAYFITICTHNREWLFGEIADGEMKMNDAGQMVQTVWDEMSIRFDGMELDRFVVMPNHIHGIIVLPRRGESCIRPYDRIRPCINRPCIIRPCNPPYERPCIHSDPSNGHSTDYRGDHGDHDHNGHHGDYKGDHHHKGDHKDRPYGTLPGTVGRIIQAFKSITTHEYTNGVKQHCWLPFNGKLWQRNYWEHIIRNETELNRICEYIDNNPALWESDKLYGRPARRPDEIREPDADYGLEAWMV